MHALKYDVVEKIGSITQKETDISTQQDRQETRYKNNVLFMQKKMSLYC